MTVDAGLLAPATSWGKEDVEGRDGAGQGDDPVGDAVAEASTATEYRPPFSFLSDMLFALALCPTRPLRDAFPGVPFLSVFGRIVLLVWLSRVREGCSRDASGEWRCEGGADAVLYHEVTVVAPLARRAFFVPGIYATSVRSMRIARHYYSMPKRTTTMDLRVDGARFQASQRHRQDGPLLSFVRARVLGRGDALGRIVSGLLPKPLWPACFPARTEAHGVIEATPRLHLAFVQQGQLSLGEEWLPEPAPLFPIGVYAPRLRMRLLPP